MHLIFYTLLIFLSGLLSSCRVHQQMEIDSPSAALASETYNSLPEGEGVDHQGEWWKEYGVPELNELVSCAFSNNLNLKQSWWRVAQACWHAKVVGSRKYPEIFTSPSVIYTGSSGDNTLGAFEGGAEFGGIEPVGRGDQTFYLLSNTLTYEVDLWRRIDSEAKAACYQLQATQEDLEASAWLLAGSVVDLWFTIQEQQTLLAVIDHQIEVSRTQLELIELRYSLGQSSSLDVYQQRLQFSETEQQRTLVETRLDTAQNLMAVLLGTTPSPDKYRAGDGLAELPPFPNVGLPFDLLCNRPDLRAIYRRIESADYQVAAAVADCFPKLSLFMNYDFQTDKIKDLFSSQLSSILVDLAQPLFDGGRRRAEVKRRRAAVCELVNAYGQGFLDALLEVEDSLVEERQQLKLIKQVEQAYEIAKGNLEESYSYYVNGQSDYLNVIAAIQSEQVLQRRLVSEKKNLLTIRAKLYRSLGGPRFTKCN